MRTGTEIVTRLNVALTERRALLAALLPDTIRPERLIQGIGLACWKNADLLECTFPSLVEGALDAAALGVTPDGTSGQAWLIPFNDKIKGKVARLVVGYRGVTAIAARNGFIISADTVLDGDQFTYREGTSPLVEHVVAMNGKRGAVIGSWATASPRGGGVPLVAVLPREKLDQIKARAPSSKRPGSPWNDMQGGGFVGMCRKSAIRALWPLLPLADRQDQVRGHVATGDDDTAVSVAFQPTARAASKRPTIIDVDDLADTRPAADRGDLGQPAPADQGEFGFGAYDDAEPEADVRGR